MTAKDVSPIGRRIRELRNRRKWSGQKLSDATGGAISRTRVSELETGQGARISLNQAAGIARAFGLSLDQLTDFNTPASAFAIAAEIADAKSRLRDALLDGGGTE